VNAAPEPAATDASPRATGPSRPGMVILAAGGVVFALLATLNCGGYRYGD